jgi:hypothetical protein
MENNYALIENYMDAIFAQVNASSSRYIFVGGRVKKILLRYKPKPNRVNKTFKLRAKRKKIK